MIRLPQIHELMNQPMNRKEFMQHIGIAMLAIVGVTAFIKNLEQLAVPRQKSDNARIGGYGSTPYGK